MTYTILQSRLACIEGEESRNCRVSWLSVNWVQQWMKRTNLNYSYADYLFINLWGLESASPLQQLIIAPLKKQKDGRGSKLLRLGVIWRVKSHGMVCFCMTMTVSVQPTNVFCFGLFFFRQRIHHIRTNNSHWRKSFSSRSPCCLNDPKIKWKNAAWIPSR